MQTLLGFTLSMTITMVLIPLLMRWAVPLGFLDIPEPRKVHAAPVPRVGGIAIVAGVMTSLLLWGDSSRPMQALWAGIGVLVCFGVWDDRRELGAGPKFAGQALAVAVAMSWGGICVATVTGAERMLLPQFLSVPLTFLFLLGGTNAFNLADGLDGLAGGMAMLCLCGTALLAFTVGNGMVGSAAAMMVGALIGFLRFNTHPARVFMGDSGSQVLGFTAAALAILLTQDSQIPLSTALPLLLLGMPIIDTLMVMAERLVARQSPFRADRRHIHHRLLALGFEHWEAVSILYLAQGALFIAAWYLRYASDLDVLAVFVLFAVLVLAPLRIAQILGLRIRRAVGAGWWAPGTGMPDLATPDPVALGTMASRRGLQTLPHTAAAALVGCTLAVFAGWVLLYGAVPSRDLRQLAVILSSVLLASLMLRWHRSDAGWAEKVALYCSAALAMFLSKQALPNAAHPAIFECVMFPLLALAVLVYIRTSKDRPFRITPLDILVLLVVLTVPNLPNSIASARSLGVTVAELVLLFYGIEALSFAAGRRWRWISAAAAVFLFGLALRAGL
jgi:UDP-GlcNAc:undecaprenyl-phosphate GlcNAc-1-phosphate transferase